MSLVFDGLTVSLNETPLVRLDRTIEPGEILSVVGPSGAGKSSLLHAIAGLLEPPFALSGRIILNGRNIADVPAERRGIALMGQDALLFPHMSVLGNVLFAVPRGAPRARRRAEAFKHLASVELGALAERDPDTLSGGQKSRVALARTLASTPGALLLDEPFAALDQALRAEMRAMVFHAARTAGLPTLLVSHDPADAAAAGGPIVTIEALPSPPDGLI